MPTTHSRTIYIIRPRREGGSVRELPKAVETRRGYLTRQDPGHLDTVGETCKLGDVCFDAIGKLVAELQEYESEEDPETCCQCGKDFKTVLMSRCGVFCGARCISDYVHKRPQDERVAAFVEFVAPVGQFSKRAKG